MGGLISPQAGGKSSTHWRLKKKHFGRVWLKAVENVDHEAMSSICMASSASEVQLALRGEDSEVREAKPIPAWAQRWLPAGLRAEGPLQSFLKRSAPLRPSGFDPSAKRAKGVDKSRAR